MAVLLMSDGEFGSRVPAKPTDRRMTRRYKLNWPVRLRGDDSQSGCFEETSILRDLSATGAFSYASRHPHLGSRLSISIKLPFKQGSWMIYSGTVLRVETSPSGIGVAIQFDTSRPEFASSES
jgi:hypothetical protein